VHARELPQPVSARCSPLPIHDPDPRRLLLDEPSAGLEPDFFDVVFDKIGEFRNHGLSELVVEQKARESLAFSDYAYVLDMGLSRYEGRGKTCCPTRPSSTVPGGGPAPGGSDAARATRDDSPRVAGSLVGFEQMSTRRP
jgi:energy-coupling factor transporter ATP-binding protein EcfA2